MRWKILRALAATGAFVMGYTFSGPSGIILFPPLLSLLSAFLSLFPFNRRVACALGYISASSLILGAGAAFFGLMLVPAVYFLGGLVILASVVQSQRKSAYLEDFALIFFSLLGFWFISLTFLSLGNIAFLFGMTTSLVIGYLSYDLVKETPEQRELPFLGRFNKYSRVILWGLTIFLATFYWTVLFFDDRLTFLQSIEAKYLGLALVLLVLILVLPGKRQSKKDRWG